MRINAIYNECFVRKQDCKSDLGVYIKLGYNIEMSYPKR